MKQDLKIKDHFLSNEVFNVVKHSEGMLKTQPDLDEKTLDKYYDSSKYSSHYNVGGFIGFKVFFQTLVPGFFVAVNPNNIIFLFFEV